MSKEEIDNLSDEEISELGEPILKATEGTVKFSKKVLQQLQGPNSQLIRKLQTITRKEHNTLSEEAKKILSSDKNRTARNLRVENIAPDSTGTSFGAIRFDNSKDLLVSDSYFEDVASSILFNDSEGPLRVIDNEASNPGRNFFQCDKCEGNEIRINGNSLEHNSQYGEDPLEDFINIYESDGEDDDYIQVNNNRARTNATGSGVSDDGGEYQEAEDNIGVNPGNVGIGASGGEYISVNDNKMYSDPIEDISNVAFYSYRVLGSDPCSNHTFSGNVAHWYCYRGDCGADPHANPPDDPILNKAHAPSSSGSSIYCGLTLSQITHNSRVLQDTNMDEDVWDEW